MGLVDALEHLAGAFSPFDELVDKTAESVVEGTQESDRLGYGGNDAVIFSFTDGTKYELTHHQDCCESVWVEDIIGDLNDLVGSPLLMAEEAYEDASDNDDSMTWSFYKFATAKGYVTIRFCGTSNGYYSETAGLYRIA